MSLGFLGRVVLWLAVATLAAGPCYAQGKGHGRGHQQQDEDNDQGPGHGHGRGQAKKYSFSAHDREVIGRFYGQPSNLPPGLAKRGGNLPPGLEKQLQRNGTLPPGLQKRIQPCPVELERQLPPLPPAYRRGIIGAHIVVFNRNTRVIVDILRDAVR